MRRVHLPRGSEELRQLNSDRMRAEHQDPELKAKRTSAMVAAIKSPEVRARRSASMKERWKDSEFRARNLAKLRAWSNSLEGKAKLHAKRVAKWQDPEYRAKAIANLEKGRDKGREKVSALLKARWSDPEFRERIAEAKRASNARPEVRQKRVALLAEVRKKAGYRERHRAGVVAAWADPEQRARRVAACKTPEARQRASDRFRALWSDPERRLKWSEGQRLAAQKRWQEDPQYRADLLARLNSPKAKARRSKALRTLWQTPEYRRKISDATGGFLDMPEPPPERHPDHIDLDPYIEAQAAERDRADEIARMFGVRPRVAREAVALMDDEGLSPQEAIEAVR